MLLETHKVLGLGGWPYGPSAFGRGFQTHGSGTDRRGVRLLKPGETCYSRFSRPPNNPASQARNPRTLQSQTSGSLAFVRTPRLAESAGPPKILPQALMPRIRLTSMPRHPETMLAVPGTRSKMALALANIIGREARPSRSAKPQALTQTVSQSSLHWSSFCEIPSA